MISQVHDIDLRQQAYEAGIEFFIDKPINFVEVKTVTEKVAQNIQMQQKINNIKSLVESPQTKQQPQEQELKRKKVLSILRFLGITSETGSSDILAISQIMIENNIFFSDIEFLNNYNITNAEKKILFQRIRRGIKKGLTNLANIYLDEFENEISIEYANSLYGYKNVRAEMRYLTGDRTTGGKVSLKKFFDGLLHECNGINF
ncbi:DNA-binding domain-containing protein [Liquorilactobacillus nagelii]|nr:DNA-binding domain-containing protein [Liquorilactobacillus nagelii]